MINPASIEDYPDTTFLSDEEIDEYPPYLHQQFYFERAGARLAQLLEAERFGPVRDVEWLEPVTGMHKGEDHFRDRATGNLFGLWVQHLFEDACMRNGDSYRGEWDYIDAYYTRYEHPSRRHRSTPKMHSVDATCAFNAGFLAYKSSIERENHPDWVWRRKRKLSEKG